MAVMGKCNFLSYLKGSRRVLTASLGVFREYLHLFTDDLISNSCGGLMQDTTECASEGKQSG